MTQNRIILISSQTAVKTDVNGSKALTWVIELNNFSTVMSNYKNAGAPITTNSQQPSVEPQKDSMVFSFSVKTTEKKENGELPLTENGEIVGIVENSNSSNEINCEDLLIDGDVFNDTINYAYVSKSILELFLSFANIKKLFGVNWVAYEVQKP